MAVEDVVSILTEYCARGEESFREDYGSQALIAMQDIKHLLETELESQLGRDALWERFESDPRAMSPDVSGALEALVEADPALADKLDGLLKEFHAAGELREPQGAVPDRPASEPPPFAARRQPPVDPQETVPRDHRSNAGEGTYLYGNVRGGDATVGDLLEMSADALEVRNEFETLSFEPRQLFTQLTNTLHAAEGLPPDLRADLRDELDDLAAEIAKGREADEHRLVQILHNIGRLDRGFLELVLTGLGNMRSEARFIVQDAIEQVNA